MNIGDLKEYPLLYKKALSYMNTSSDTEDCNLSMAFVWSDTQEGRDFWSAVHISRSVKEIPEPHKHLNFHLFLETESKYIREGVRKVSNGLWEK